jgi:hypothetical protein
MRQGFPSSSRTLAFLPLLLLAAVREPSGSSFASFGICFVGVNRENSRSFA